MAEWLILIVKYLEKFTFFGLDLWENVQMVPVFSSLRARILDVVKEGCLRFFPASAYLLQLICSIVMYLYNY